MGSIWQNCAGRAALVLAFTASFVSTSATAAAEPPNTHTSQVRCPPAAAASKPQTKLWPKPATVSPPALVCGDMLSSVALTLAAPAPVAVPASAASAADKARDDKTKDDKRAQPAPSTLALLKHGSLAAAGLSLLLLLAGLVAGASRGGFGLTGHAGSFGGRGWSWEATPALTLLVCAAVVMALCLVLAWQLLQFDGPKAALASAPLSTQGA